MQASSCSVTCVPLAAWQEWTRMPRRGYITFRRAVAINALAVAPFALSNT